jgi:hypothetical protein
MPLYPWHKKAKPMSVPYRLPEHARQYFGSKVNDIWGGVPWKDSEREEPENEESAYAGLATSGLQWFPPIENHHTRALFWQSDADIDFDGPSKTITARDLKKRDRYWLPNTSLQWENPWTNADGKSTRACDSRTFMGVVMPPGLRTFGLECGDYALVCWGGKIAAAQVYDIGPMKKIGEISFGLAAALGIPNDPTRGNDVKDLCTLAFPGSGRRRAVPMADQWEMAMLGFGKLTGRAA